MRFDSEFHLLHSLLKTLTHYVPCVEEEGTRGLLYAERRRGMGLRQLDPGFRLLEFKRRLHYLNVPLEQVVYSL